MHLDQLVSCSTIRFRPQGVGRRSSASTQEGENTPVRPKGREHRVPSLGSAGIPPLSDRLLSITLLIPGRFPRYRNRFEKNRSPCREFGKDAQPQVELA
jgi:hypothetical protein